MALPKTTNEPGPTLDGEVHDYTHWEVAALKKAESPCVDPARKVIFVNGMGNTGENHAESALALSLVQMCTVIGVFNKTGGTFTDLVQCVADKNQFDGLSLSAKNAVGIRLIFGQTSIQAARNALSRNRAQVALFDVVRANRGREIFAHSQGNLILSNVLQAVAAVDGPSALHGLVVHTFGSPAVNWPSGITKHEHGFTFDPVNWLSGFDSTFTISKVGWPQGSWNPITHGFLEYMKNDPTFLVNRYRTGGLGVTFDMDEEALAKALADMGPNMRRVYDIFQHLRANHGSDADDVAELYVDLARTRPMVANALKSYRPLRDLLIRILGSGATFPGEARAIAYLQALDR